MKKLVMAATAVSLSAMMLAGCGDSTEEQTQESVAATEESSEAAESETVEELAYDDEAYMDYLNVDDFVELGDYLGVEVTVEAPYVSDAQVESYIQNVVSNNPVRTEITDRAVQDGDVTDISYVGKKDDVAFDGGTADNYELTIGSGTFIDGFEDGIIGMEIGETKDLDLTFPENYGNSDLAGAKVVFTVTLNKIYEESEAEFNDDFVAGLEIEDVSTAEEYRQYVYDGLMQNAQSQYELDVENAVVNAVYQNATFKAVPEAMADRYYDRLVTNITYQAAMYGADLETFMNYFYGMQPEQYEADMKDSAQQAAEQILMLQAIAEREGLTVSDEELEEAFAKQAEEYGYDSADAYKEVLGDEVKGYREFVMSEKVTAFLIENANITETEPETAEAETETASEDETADAGTASEGETADAGTASESENADAEAAAEGETAETESGDSAKTAE